MQKHNNITCVVIDEANFSNTLRLYGYKLNWRIIRDFFLEHSDNPDETVFDIFVGLPPVTSDFVDKVESRQRLFAALRNHGYGVHIRQGIPVRRLNEPVSYTANVDVMLALETYKLVVNVRPSQLILVTHDAAFDHLIKVVKKEGTKVTIAGVRARLGKALMSRTNDYIDCTPLLDRLSSSSYVPNTYFHNNESDNDVYRPMTNNS